jgi:glutathione reductase (NADPH)
MSQYDYDLFTIGGGSGGVRASRFAAQYGARVAIAEASYWGGTCVNVGCIPKKLLSYSAHFHEDFSDAAGFGWSVGATRVDWRALIAAKDLEIARLNGIYRKLLTGAGAELIDGHARIEDAHTVSVNGKRYSAQHILVATGGKPTLPSIPGNELGITSDQFFHLAALPQRTIVLGGGYIAVELASILNGLGSEVTLVYRGKSLLRGMDTELGIFLAEEMRKKGVTILLENNIESITAEAGGSKQVRLVDGTKISVDCVLFATGRHANTSGIGLENAGVELKDSGAVSVDAHFCTSVASIHAIGDVIERVALTPVALAEGMVVAARLFGPDPRTMSYDNIATAVFSHPQVATVGLSEEAARKKGMALRIFKSDFRALKHTMSGNAERSFMKLVVDAESDRVLGVHMVGAEAGEILQGFAVALQCGATKAQFDSTIGIHPTVAEEFVTMRTPVAAPSTSAPEAVAQT